MAFISELMNRPVTDLQGRQIGVVKDLIARSRKEMTHPVIEAVEVDQRGETQLVPYNDVAALLSAAVPLRVSQESIQPYQPQEDDFFLVSDVLDKQIIDIDGARVVRVNDIELVRVNGHVVVSNVDIGLMGLLRRIGLASTASAVLNRFGRKIRENKIAWDYVELLRRDPYMRLRVPVDKLAELHPADIAEILTDLSQAEGKEFLDSLNLEQLADTLEEVETDLQLSLVESMPDERVADVLEEMSPDDAADLLAELPSERSEGILKLMQKEDAEDVRLLLGYPENSAGGLMTTEFATVTPEMTTMQAINHLRQTAREAETIFYVYVTDKEEHLVGVLSLKDLVLADPDTPIIDFMHKRVVSVEPATDQDELAQQVSKYNLIALPVVDSNNHLLGIVTADDALDKIIPTAWKKRLPRFFH
jgi:magnesium transporter